MNRIYYRAIRLIVESRFIPVETIIAFGGVVLGIWLSITGVDTIPAPFSVFASAWLALIGILHLVGLSKDESAGARVALRRHASFFEFLNFTYVAVLLGISFGLASFGWFAYLLLALVAGTAYLSLTLEGSHMPGQQVGVADEL